MQQEENKFVAVDQIARLFTTRVKIIMNFKKILLWLIVIAILLFLIFLFSPCSTGVTITDSDIYGTWVIVPGKTKKIVNSDYSIQFHSDKSCVINFTTDSLLLWGKHNEGLKSPLEGTWKLKYEEWKNPTGIVIHIPGDINGIKDFTSAVVDVSLYRNLEGLYIKIYNDDDEYYTWLQRTNK